VVVVQVDEPPGEGELLSMRSVGICATDLSYLRLGTRRVLGHELVGSRPDGTAVAVEALYGCGTCEQCLAGRVNLCTVAVARSLGIVEDGGMVEGFRAPSARLVALPASIDPRDGALVEPLAVACHGLRIGGGSVGARVAVVGGGPVGVLSGVVAQGQGAAVVDLQARHPHQHEVRERLGMGEPDGVYDLVVEAAGSIDSIERCLELVRPGGTVVVLGVFGRAMEVPFRPFLLKEVSVRASIGYCDHGDGSDMLDAATLLAARPEIADAVISHRFPIDDAAEAFRTASDRSRGVMKVVVEVG
jgi:2-desacetyl-2-hydroxyethyl bacteriochlorophyllide A dehydrogenase